MERWTRRDVLRIGAGGLAAGLAQSTLGQTAPGAAGREPVRLGVIGVGGRGAGLVRALIRRKEAGHRIVAICDTNADNRNQSIKAVADSLGYSPEPSGKDAEDFRNLLARKDIDAVIMATPCWEHARMYIAAIEAGKHIYGEKPMALSVAEADAVVAAAAARPKVIVQVGFQWMLNTRMMDAVHRVHKGEIGDLIEGRFHRHNGAPPLFGWFGRREKSGDWMLEQACHEYNIMNLTARATPLRAYGIGRTDLFTDRQADRNVTDSYSVILEYPGGFTVHYAHGWISPKGFTGMSMIAVGSRGAVDILDGRIALRDENAKAEPIAAEKENDTEAALVAFLDSVRTGAAPAATAVVGRNATLTALLVRKAVYERRIVTWDEMLKTC